MRKVAETEAVERRQGCRATLRSAEAGKARLHGHVVEAVEVVDQIETGSLTDDTHMSGAQLQRCSMIELGEIVTEQANASGAGPDLSRERSDQRRLTGPARSPHDDSLPCLHPQAQPAKRSDIVGSTAVQHKGVVDVDDGLEWCRNQS